MKKQKLNSKNSTPSDEEKSAYSKLTESLNTNFKRKKIDTSIKNEEGGLDDIVVEEDILREEDDCGGTDVEESDDEEKKLTLPSYFDHQVDATMENDLRSKYQSVNSLVLPKMHTVQYLRRTERKDDTNMPFKEDVFHVKQISDLIDKYGIHQSISNNWPKVKTKKKDKSTLFTELQQELLNILISGSSLYYPNQDILNNAEDLRKVYCLYLTNHVFKSRLQVLKNNSKLSKKTPVEQEQADCRDQGLVRPKILILVPFRETAKKVVDILITLLKKDEKSEVGSKKRFHEEFRNPLAEDEEEIMKSKPEDYKKLFAGNTEENFRFGLSLFRKTVRLFSPFYSSDIIISSPLGLRMIIGDKGEAHHEFDFLSSIEMMVMDLSDVFLMQNWEHVVHIMKHINLQPKGSHGVDFSRVRESILDGHAKYFCQKMIFSSVYSPQIASILTKYCYNYKGLAMVNQAFSKGSICGIPRQLPQIFHKLDSGTANFGSIPDLRFQFFLDHILKKFKREEMSNTLIYIPQYYDFVRVRNHMRREMKAASGPRFNHICEYSESKVVGKARRSFLTGNVPLLLYTERYHFYHRPFIRGIKKLVFYELPTYPQYYSELCNMVRSRNDLTANSVIAIYSRFDSSKLSAIVGDKRSVELLNSVKDLHMFVSGH